MILASYFTLSHFWFATVQEVLQADWQELVHLPQPPFSAEDFRLALLIVTTCFNGNTSFKYIAITAVIYYNISRDFFQGVLRFFIVNADFSTQMSW